MSLNVFLRTFKAVRFTKILVVLNFCRYACSLQQCAMKSSTRAVIVCSAATVRYGGRSTPWQAAAKCLRGSRQMQGCRQQYCWAYANKLSRVCSGNWFQVYMPKPLWPSFL
ncbi:hypothetical protein NPIL_89601 [Nephila pilipes]|uniref:Uncharacterized protein n=1 Tax=Nephila pilipes TaxID=299642 RepID=A0A8X6TAS9_NEPPI|nr:hypothetical protein NPIL_89601 [Nephila pilipes]